MQNYFSHVLFTLRSSDLHKKAMLFKISYTPQTNYKITSRPERNWWNIAESSHSFNFTLDTLQKSKISYNLLKPD